MKKFIYILIILLFASCITPDSSTQISKSLFNSDKIELKSENSTDLSTFRLLGRSISDLPTSLLTEDIDTNKDYSISYLDNEMHIASKKELKEIIDWYYYNGLRGSINDAMTSFLLRPELLNSSDELLKEENWAHELSSGTIKDSMFKTFRYLIVNGKFINLEDARIYDLTFISLLTRAGVTAGFLTESESNSIYDQICLELMSFSGSWYDFAKSYVAGVAFLFRGNDRINPSIYKNSLMALKLINHTKWKYSDITDLQKLYESINIQEEIKLDNDHIYNVPLLNPKLEADAKIKLIFNTNRKTYDLISVYKQDYNLYLAVKDDDYKEVKNLISQGYEFYNYINHNGNSTIHEATDKNIRILESLLNLGFDPDLREHTNNDTPLHQAVRNKKYSAISVLLKNNADPNILNLEDKTPLCIAVNNNDIRAVSLLLENGADPEIGYVSDYSVLGLSLRNNYELIGKKLLDHIKDINGFAYKDWSYIHMATRYSSLALLEYLLFKDPDINIQKDNGSTAFILVRSSEQDDHLERYKLLYKMGADTSIPKKNTYTALLDYLDTQHFDIYNKLKEDKKSLFSEVDNFAPLFRYLLDVTNDKYVQTDSLRSGLWFLRNYGSIDDINYFLDNTPDQKIAQKSSYTILRSLMYRDQKDEFRRVVQRAENLNYKNDNGWNILYLAYSKPHFRWATQILLENDADINLLGPKDSSIIDMLGRLEAYDEFIEAFDSGATIKSMEETLEILGVIDTDKKKDFISKLKERNITTELKNKYISQKGAYFTYGYLKDLEHKKKDNKISLINKTDKNILMLSKTDFPTNNDFRMVFTIEDFDKGLELLFSNKKGNQRDINFIVNINDKHSDFGILNDENKIHHNQNRNELNLSKGKTYIVEFIKQSNNIRLIINGIECDNEIIDSRIGESAILLIPKESVVKISHVDFITEGL
ncbi:MAG: ankyrin repeat domain-containing protein [Spirochaetaceae bacterium]